MQQTIFNSHAAGEDFGKSVSNAGDVNGDGYDDIIIGASGNNNYMGKAYIYFGGINMNTVADVTLTGELTFNFFGCSVASAGDINNDGYADVIVGAYNATSNGRIYIFKGGANMDNIPDLIVAGETAGDYFGYSVASAGDVNNDGYSDVIIGAYKYSGLKGRAYILFGGSTLDPVADVIMTGEAVNNNFGYSVSSAGDVNGDGYSDVIVGANGYNTNTGRAYIFYGGAGMNNVADVTMTGETTTNYFGNSVSYAKNVNGDIYSDVVVGAYGYNNYYGRAYVFYGGANMNNVADVIMTGEGSGNVFGICVSSAKNINGDAYWDVIVSAQGFGGSRGKVYIFFGGINMDNNADLSASGETTQSASFGYSVSSAGDVNGDGYSEIIASAPIYNSNSGRAYLIMNSVNTSDLTMTGENTNSYYGHSVAAAGDLNGDGYGDVIVGSYRYGASFTGRAYIFYGGQFMDNVADIILTGGGANNYFGFSVSSAGDVNNDGYPDVIVGTGSNIGKTYIYYGGPAMDNIADVIFTRPGEYLGYSVSAAGDVNSDGYSDVIVGANGKAYIYYGGSPMNNVEDVTFTGETISDAFGNSVSGAGDVNGDGYSDVIVGAWGHGSFGRAYIYYGGSSMDNTADVILDGDSIAHAFGISLSTAGDVNKDGYADVIVGTGFSNVAKIYYGSALMNNIPDITLRGDPTSDNFGYSVSTAGDVNGDGYSDVIVGDYDYNVDTGRVYVFYGGTIMNDTADIIMTGEKQSSFGISATTAGDLNGDGVPDIIAGADHYNNIGKAYIFMSSAVRLDITVNLFMYIEGFYNANTNLQVHDTINTYLRNNTSPYNIVDSSKSIVATSGLAILKFKNASTGSYYLVIKHRNSIETWSACRSLSDERKYFNL